MVEETASCEAAAADAAVLAAADLLAALVSGFEGLRPRSRSCSRM